MRAAYLAKKAKVSKKTSLLSKLAEKAFTLHGATTTAVVQATYKASSSVGAPPNAPQTPGTPPLADSSTSDETLPHISLGDTLHQFHSLDEMVMATDPLSMDVSLQNPLFTVPSTRHVANPGSQREHLSDGQPCGG